MTECDVRFAIHNGISFDDCKLAILAAGTTYVNKACRIPGFVGPSRVALFVI